MRIAAVRCPVWPRDNASGAISTARSEGRRDGSGLMYMRNRYYDPHTARFTQEDPIGLGGGLNLYGFAAGDPVTYSDPYGLKVCANARHLRQAIEWATNSTIQWDASNCVASTDNVTFHGGAAWSQIQEQFATFVNSGATYYVNRGQPGRENPVGCDPGCSWYDYGTRTAWIFDQDFDRTENGKFYKGITYRPCGFRLFWPRYGVAEVVLHELFGHGQYSNPSVGTHANRRVFSYENTYRGIQGRPEKC